MMYYVKPDVGDTVVQCSGTALVSISEVHLRMVLVIVVRPSHYVHPMMSSSGS